jgi:hypothetical protein
LRRKTDGFPCGFYLSSPALKQKGKADESFSIAADRDRFCCDQWIIVYNAFHAPATAIILMSLTAWMRV